MDYRRIAEFVQVVESGSFTAAARSLELPKSSVSRGVAALERELGVRLLQRTTRKLTLTDAGQRLFDRVRPSLSGITDAVAAAREQGNEPSGTIRMTAAPDSHATGLGEAIARFVAKYPRISVEVVLTSRSVDLVGEGIDLALRAGTLPDSSLVARKIGVSDAALFASPKYLDERGRPRKLSDLAHHDFVVYRGNARRSTLRLTGPDGDETVEVSGRVGADETGFLIRVVAAGAGVGLFPVQLAGPLVESGELELVLHSHRLSGAALYVVLPSSAFVPVRVALLRDHLVEVFAREIERTTRTCERTRVARAAVSSARGLPEKVARSRPRPYRE